MAERQYRRRGAVVAAGVVMVAGGCGEAVPDGGGGEGVAVVRGAAAELVRARSSKAHTSMEMAAGGTRVTIRGRGVYDFREQVGQLRVSLPQGPVEDSSRQPITELLAPGALFMKNRGAGVPEDKWVRVETGSMADGNLVTGGATDPLAAAEILRGARDVRYVGAERVGGVDVRHYRGVADLGRAARRASEGPRDALAAAAKGFATPRVPFDVYLDEEGRIRKVRHRFSFVNGQQERPVDVASTTLLYDFGVDVDVRLPDRDDIFAGRIAEE
ncbi:lipoprotein [Streptomyces sp. NBRC 14336]|nr:lipoprotein [Streptomyces sp. NBRC 14336]